MFVIKLRRGSLIFDRSLDIGWECVYIKSIKIHPKWENLWFFLWKCGSVHTHIITNVLFNEAGVINVTQINFQIIIFNNAYLQSNEFESKKNQS